MHPTSALFNHSCRPNAVVVFPLGATQLEMIAIRNIAEGDEVLISYVDVSMDRDDRRKDLKAGYGFDCDCELCVEQEKLATTRKTSSQEALLQRAKGILKEDESGRLGWCLPIVMKSVADDRSRVD